MVPPADRRSFLIEQFGRQLQKVDWRPAEHLDPRELRATCSYASRQDVRLADVLWSSGSVHKADSAFDDYLLVHLERQQGGWCELTDGTLYRNQPGTFMVYHEEQFVAAGVPPDLEFNFQLVAISRRMFEKVEQLADPGRLIYLRQDNRFNAMVARYFVDWCRALPDLAEHQVEVTTESLLRLLAVAGDALDPRSDEASRDVSALRVQTATRFIASNLTRPDLTPQRVADALGISLRQLHLDFEPSGTSVARRILAARVELAKRQLLAQPHISVIEVAFACGFEGLSTFYRAFKAATGITATEYREQGRQAARETR